MKTTAAKKCILAVGDTAPSCWRAVGVLRHDYVLPGEMHGARDGVTETLALYELQRNTVSEAQLPQPGLTATCHTQSVEDCIDKLHLT